jgi:hypothetical protein
MIRRIRWIMRSQHAESDRALQASLDEAMAVPQRASMSIFWA